MRFYHTKCGGEIDIKHRKCLRCGKKWNPISFRLDPSSIRMKQDRKSRPSNYRLFKQEREVFNKTISKLPKWPRWARILTSVVVIAAIAVIIYLVWR